MSTHKEVRGHEAISFQVGLSVLYHVVLYTGTAVRGTQGWGCGHVGVISGVREPTVSSVPSAACLVVRSWVTCPVHGHGRVRAAGLGASLESSPEWPRRLLLELFYGMTTF